MSGPFDLDAETGFFGHRPPVGPIKNRFTLNPFSTWNTRECEWLRRRRIWIDRGIKSEEGRDGKLTYNIPLLLSDGRKGRKKEAQTSIFDPVICELVYGWWCKPGGVVLDPFAGGSVRGIVASVMGLKYAGIELREEQVLANRAQLNKRTTGDFAPKWVCGDAFEDIHDAPECDLLFSCPPYGNLEVYSEDPKDISNMDYGGFLDRYSAIIKAGVGKLRDNRFACFVVGNYRDRNRGGVMTDFVGDTIRAFEAAGANYYNDIVLINSVGTGPMRTNGSFARGSRKVIKLHQNVLIFIKGDAKAAAAEIPVKWGPGTGEGEGDGEVLDESLYDGHI